MWLPLLPLTGDQSAGNMWPGRVCTPPVPSGSWHAPHCVQHWPTHTIILHLPNQQTRYSHYTRIYVHSHGFIWGGANAPFKIYRPIPEFEILICKSMLVNSVPVVDANACVCSKWFDFPTVNLCLPLSHSQGRLNANRPVPFRLTPGLQTLVTKLGLTGPLQMAMLSTARCLAQPHISLESILRAVLRDEFISWKKVHVYHSFSLAHMCNLCYGDVTVQVIVFYTSMYIFRALLNGVLVFRSFLCSRTLWSNWLYCRATYNEP